MKRLELCEVEGKPPAMNSRERCPRPLVHLGRVEGPDRVIPARVDRRRSYVQKQTLVLDVAIGELGDPVQRSGRVGLLAALAASLKD